MNGKTINGIPVVGDSIPKQISDLKKQIQELKDLVLVLAKHTGLYDEQ